MTRVDLKTTLLFVALKNEPPRRLVLGWQPVNSRVGKMNAAITLCAALVSYRLKRAVEYFGAVVLRQGLLGQRCITRFQ